VSGYVKRCNYTSKVTQRVNVYRSIGHIQNRTLRGLLLRAVAYKICREAAWARESKRFFFVRSARLRCCGTPLLLPKRAKLVTWKHNSVQTARGRRPCKKHGQQQRKSGVPRHKMRPAGADRVRTLAFGGAQIAIHKASNSN